MRSITREFLQQGDCQQCLSLHAQILADLARQLDGTQTIRSHYFHGRYENIYISADRITGLPVLLEFLQAQAAQILAATPGDLKLGFWFNIMQQGDVTTLHSHDDNDELLSGTYYLQMPPAAGKLLIHFPGQVTTIEPVSGHFVFFHPAVSHEVTSHQSVTPRVSLGFNLGIE